MGHILHDWDVPSKKMLIQRAFDALPSGGALVAYDSIIDDAWHEERVRSLDELEYAH